MNKKYYFLILLGIGLFLLFPTDIEAYTPIGEYIFFNVSPASETTLGGIYAENCDSGKLLQGVFVNGSLNCGVP